MYVMTNGQQYPCVGFKDAGDEVRLILSGDALPESPGETVELYQDDGFLLASKTVADYERWEMAGHTLVLTNRPVPEPVPESEPETPTPTVQEAMLDMLADLDYRVNQQEVAAIAAQNSEEG